MEYLERKINVFEPCYVKPIHAVQGSNMLEIRITIQDWNIPNGSTVKWQVATSTKGEINNTTFDNNTIIIHPYTTTFSEVGHGYLQVRVEKDDKVLVSFAIDVFIFRDRLISPVEGSNSDVVKVLVDQYVEEATGTLFEDLEAQAQSELASIRATGQSVLDSIPIEYSELEDATYNAYPLGTAEGNPIIIEDGSDNIPVKNLSVDLVPKQSGTGDPSPTNVRTISGYDGVVIKRTGKNLLDFDNENNPNRSVFNYLTDTAETVKATKVSGGGAFLVQFKTTVKEGESYTASFGDYTFDGAEQSAMAVYVYSDRLWGNAIKGNWSVSKNGSSWVSTYTGDVVVGIFNSSAVGTTIELNKFQLELGSTATEYEPYKGQEYSITFPTKVGTVYSGRLNVTTGELKVTYGIVTDFSALASNGTSSTGAYRYKLAVAGVAGFTIGEAKCNMLKFKAGFNGNAGEFYNGTGVFNIFLADSTVESAITTLTGCQIVYPLATPTTVQLTPTEVSTLLGYNVIQSDGDMDLEYRADIVGYYTGMNEAVDIVKNTADYIDTSKEFSVKEKRILECDIPKCESSLEAYLNGELSFTLRHRDASNSKAYFPLSPKYTYKLTVDSDKSYTAKLVVEPQRALFLGGLYNGIPIVSAGNKRTNLINVIEQAFIYISCDYTTAVDGYKDGAYVGRKTAYCGVYSPSVVDVSEYDYVCLVSNGVGQIYYSLGDSNRFVGKKWCSYGDSITEQNRWQNLLVAKYGLIHANKGLGGSCVTGETDNTVAPMTDSARINSIDTDTDIITVMGGTNDFDYCADIGTIDALQESYNEATFMGSLASIVKKLQARCPNARIILMSLVNSRGVTGQNSDNQQVSRYGFTPYDFAKATKEVAEWLSVDYIDTWSCGINQLNRAKYISDSVHPNDEGGKMIAFKIMQYFDTLEV